jgi:hypothetical protein
VCTCACPVEGLGYANIGHRVVNLARLHNAPMFLAYNANRKQGGGRNGNDDVHG